MTDAHAEGHRAQRLRPPMYGHTDRIGTAPGYLFTPDGLDVLPAGTIP